MISAYDLPLWKVAFGCCGGFFIHLVVGAVYQWGLINIYIASYYKITQPDLNLEDTGVVFPLMMLCIGIGMKPGIELAKRIGAFWVLLGVVVLAAGLVFASSYVPNFVGSVIAYSGFVAIFGGLFGLVSGMSFMLPMIECNEYLPERRMYINGIILIGTGMSSVLFGQFSYNFLNPTKLAPNLGFYDGDLEYIARKVPQCLRWLSLLYIGVGLLGCFLLLPVIRHNQQAQKTVHSPVPEGPSIELSRQGPPESNEAVHAENTATVIRSSPVVQHPKPADCPSYRDAFKSAICWILALCVVLGSFGDLILNGNYKTYVKKQITDDEYLTLIGTIGAIANGCTRFFWNMLLKAIDFRLSISTIMLLNVIIFAVINYTLNFRELYCFIIFLANSSLGGLFVIVPTICLEFFGDEIGAGIYSFYWICFSLSNFIGYLLVSRLSLLIGIENILYVAIGGCVIVLVIMAAYKFKPQWQVAEQRAAPNVALD